MNKAFEGVRPASESSIEIGFVYEGRHYLERIRVKPNGANLNRAKLQLTEILAAIERGTFNYETAFTPRKTK